jgi:hypothetical protein
LKPYIILSLPENIITQQNHLYQSQQTV